MKWRIFSSNHTSCVCACVCTTFVSLRHAVVFTHWPWSFQVNSLSMQGVTHHEAVSALRNAGICIRMKVLRGRPLPPKVYDPDMPRDPPDSTGRQRCGMTGEGPRSKRCQLGSTGECLSKKTEAVICNGNNSVGVEQIKPFKFRQRFYDKPQAKSKVLTLVCFYVF